MLEQADWEDKSFGVQWGCYVANIRNDLWLSAGRLCKQSQAKCTPQQHQALSSSKGQMQGSSLGFFNNSSPEHKGKWQAEDKECWQSERWWFL